MPKRRGEKAAGARGPACCEDVEPDVFKMSQAVMWLGRGGLAHSINMLSTGG